MFLEGLAETITSYGITDYAEIVNLAIMEVLQKFIHGEDPMKDIAVDNIAVDCKDSPNSQSSPMLSPDAQSPFGCSSSQSQQLPSTLDKTLQPKNLKYLFDCYSRVAVEERNYPKVCLTK